MSDPVLSHDDIQDIVADAVKNGSLRDAVKHYAIAHGIQNVEALFPGAKLLNNTPEFFKRQIEWVNDVLSKVRRNPFSRIKTVSADLTVEEARAKGYVTGDIKAEEFFRASKRVTIPTTIYKTQKIDRDDAVDITDFNVIVWLKGEMRLMLDQEIARAILIGDGRDVASQYKINEENVRPIANDNSFYTVNLKVNIDDASSSAQEIIDAIILNRGSYKGTGLPTMYISETYLTKILLLKDTTGRFLYSNLNDLATVLRVSEIVPVDIMDEVPDIIAVIVNLADYVVGADRGGEINMFDDFDIDYNQHKYLIETRICGALTKLKSAIAVKKVAASLTLITPVAPTFDENTGILTVPNDPNVSYGFYGPNGGPDIPESFHLLSPGPNNVTDVVNENFDPVPPQPWIFNVFISIDPETHYIASSETDHWTFTYEEPM